ncbi:hypothetical protein ACF1GT_22470 [Streptomyces sp. NPDC014636]|uniref:hypothetical protein n=1 Tax=Streptomyces sp. NPDC014636 TaxID=3364876 RepID=UPI0036F5D5C2
MRVATREGTQPKRAWGARLLGAGLAAVAALGVAAGPAAAAAVRPVLVPGNPPAICPDGSAALRLDPSDDGTQIPVTIPGDGSGTITATFHQAPGADPDTLVDFTTTGSIAVHQATVKGGPNANRYVYTAPTFPNGIAADEDLVSPTNPGGQIPPISHVDFCFTSDRYYG